MIANIYRFDMYRYLAESITIFIIYTLNHLLNSSISLYCTTQTSLSFSPLYNLSLPSPIFLPSSLTSFN